MKSIKYQKENELIRSLAIKTTRYVNTTFGTKLKIHNRVHGDLSSNLDTTLDSIIVTYIKKNFPSDDLVIEESNPKAELSKPRAWIVDPLCGSKNAARGVRLFCTNISLVENGEVVAAWVIDYNRNRVISGLRGGRIFSDLELLPRIGQKTEFATVNIDWGYYFMLSNETIRNYAAVIRDLLFREEIGSLVTYDSSLPFANVATGQIEGALTINVEPWDAIAGAFLIEQNGGVVTKFSGEKWDIKTKSFVMAGNKRLHTLLMEVIKKNHLSSVR